MKTWKIVITGMLLGATCYAYNCFVNDQTSCKAAGSTCGIGQSTCVNQCNVAYSGTVTDPGLRNVCIPAGEVTPGRLIPHRAYLAVSNVLDGKPYLAELQELIVERASDESPARFTPDLGGRSTLTVDARFNEQEGPEYGMRYLATRWLSVDEVKELPSFGAYFQELQKRRLNKRTFEQTGQTRSGLFWLLFIFLAIAPVVILLLKGRGSGGGNQQTHTPSQ